MVRLTALSLATLLLVPAPGLADETDDLIDAFIGAPGWERLEADDVEIRLQDAFTNANPNAMRPDGTTGPLEKALLLIDTMEPPLPRVRTILRYGQHIADDTPYSLITVERYNLGPAVHAQVVSEVGAENAADLEEFGAGPHVAWRIVTIPMMGAEAAMLEVARREIAEEEAKAADCIVGRCLDATAIIDEHRPWQEQERSYSFASPYAERGPDGLATKARAAAELAIAMGYAREEGGVAAWGAPEQPEGLRPGEPFLFFYADGIAGQEVALDSLMGQTAVMDDSIRALWERRIEVEGSLYWMSASDKR